MKVLGVFPFLIALFALGLASASLYAATLNTTTNLIDTEPATKIPAPVQAKFAPSIDDLPLMPQLDPIADEDVLFVVPNQGRIAESTASGPVDIDEVYHFYKRSLPQLGWKIVDARTYIRDKERLRIDAHADGKITTVRFSVKPND